MRRDRPLRMRPTMTGPAGFATFLALALLIPIVLFWTVRLMAWALPPPYNWLVRYFQRHAEGAAYAEAVMWALFLVNALTWRDWSTVGLLVILVDTLLIAECLTRARRVRRERVIARAA